MTHEALTLTEIVDYLTRPKKERTKKRKLKGTVTFGEKQITIFTSSGEKNLNNKTAFAYNCSL